MKLFLLYLMANLRYPHRALLAFYWLLQGKKVRARNSLGVMITDVKNRYKIWRAKYEDLSEEAATQAKAQIAGWRYRPVFLVKTDGDLSDQWYNGYSVDAQQPYDYSIMLKAGDRLSPQALYELGAAVQDSQPDLITFDDDEITGKESRHWPYFKPQWNPLLQISSNYVGLSAALKAGCGDNVQAFMAQRLAEDQPISCVHISKILRHIRLDRSQKSNRQQAGIETWCQHLNDAAKGSKIFAQDDRGWVIEQLPVLKDKISIIIPTRDMLGFLQPCVDSLLAKTVGVDYEILIMDNDSVEEKTHTYFREISADDRVRVISYPGAFNYSAINNTAVDHATGTYVCLLNNDTEVISPTWLADMLRYAALPSVGAVGAKLLYGDQRIQHAGVVMGLGQLAGHGHRFQLDSEAGYFHRAHQLQQVQVVTAACLLVAKDKFLKVGGLDAEKLTVAFNDVDFCMKLHSEGYENIYQPAAKLYHYESKSRGKDLAGEKRERYLREAAIMHERWSSHEKMDPYYSPNLTNKTEDFSINIL